MTAVQQIDRFLKDVGTKNLLQVLRQVVARWGLALGVAVVIVHLLLPSLAMPALIAAGVFLAAAAGRTVWKQRLRIHELDRRLELRDRLATWAGLSRRGEVGRTPMAAWLTDDLAERIGAIPQPDRHAAVHRRVGVMRYLLPVLILLLVVELVAMFDEDPPPPPPPPAIAFFGPDPGEGGSGGGGGGADQQPEPDPDQTGGQQQRQPQGLPLPTPPPEGPPPAPELANPVPDLELRDEFAVPHFVGEGETRRQLARQARMAENPPPAVGTGGTAGPDQEPPDEKDFERAYERALQSRYVPEYERPFLRRYFRILREGGR